MTYAQKVTAELDQMGVAQASTLASEYLSKNPDSEQLLTPSEAAESALFGPSGK